MEAVISSSQAGLDKANIEQLYPQLFSFLTALADKPDGEFSAQFIRFVTEMEQDFAVEEQWLTYLDASTQKMHRAEHAELLSLLHHAQARVFDGDYSLARKIVPLLTGWFADHIAMMDIVWAKALSQATPSSSALLHAA